MIQYYPLFVKITGWILLAGGLLISVAALQFISKGRSALGENAVLHYFVAFSGSLNIIWGLVLLSAALDPAFAHAMAAPCAVGFSLLSLWRIPLCKMPKIQESLGKAPMAEVIVFALLAMIFTFAALQP